MAITWLIIICFRGLEQVSTLLIVYGSSITNFGKEEILTNIVKNSREIILHHDRPQNAIYACHINKTFSTNQHVCKKKPLTRYTYINKTLFLWRRNRKSTNTAHKWDYMMWINKSVCFLGAGYFCHINSSKAFCLWYLSKTLLLQVFLLKTMEVRSTYIDFSEHGLGRILWL